jgi:hypothetical protein
MNLSTGPSPKTIFASDGVLEHLVRGVVGICALSYAISISEPHPVYSLALAGVSLWAFRGCPTCWTIGLLETTYRQFMRWRSTR